MKSPLTQTKLLWLSLLAILLVFAIQACVNTGTLGGFSHSGFLQLSSAKHVPIKGGEKNFATALKKYGADYEADYCEQRGKPIVCDKFNPGNIDEMLKALKTTGMKKHVAESGSGDNLNPDAIHVSQRVTFESDKELAGFLGAIK